MRAESRMLWWFAAAYFVCYVPYSGLTRALADGRIPGADPAASGLALLPGTAVASLAGMWVFLLVSGWWRDAHRVRLGAVGVPAPRLVTLVSGLATGTIIMTTTLSYAIGGVSIVFMMLLMRGGVLVIAPIVDRLSGRRVRLPSWIALGLSMAALVVGVGEDVRLELGALAAIDAAVYVGAYFVRLRLMARAKRGEEPGADRRFFVEEQMVATPAVVVALALVALAGEGAVAAQLRHGFGLLADGGTAGVVIGIGLLSQGTGVFGALILLDAREATFCVPVNRASSVLAGVVATAILGALGTATGLDARELAGAGLLVAAIVVLALPERRAAVASAKRAASGA